VIRRVGLDELVSCEVDSVIVALSEDFASTTDH
jgi:hypothetical protein